MELNMKKFEDWQKALDEEFANMAQERAEHLQTWLEDNFEQLEFTLRDFTGDSFVAEAQLEEALPFQDVINVNIFGQKNLARFQGKQVAIFVKDEEVIPKINLSIPSKLIEVFDNLPARVQHLDNIGHRVDELESPADGPENPAG